MKKTLLLLVPLFSIALYFYLKKEHHHTPDYPEIAIYSPIAHAKVSKLGPWGYRPFTTIENHSVSFTINHRRLISFLLEAYSADEMWYYRDILNVDYAPEGSHTELSADYTRYPSKKQIHTLKAQRKRSEADYEKALIKRFIKKDKNVVLDKRLKLLWQDQKANELEYDDHWGADAYCQSLRLNGYGNWRNPTLEELLSIVTYSQENKFPPAFKHTKEGAYWTLSKDSFNQRFAFDMSSGTLVQPSRAYVRCVREIARLKKEKTDFIKKKKSLIDTKYAIVWQNDKKAATTKMDFLDAIHYCQKLTLDDKEDWVLPTIYDLQKLIFSKAFKNEPHMLWSATPASKTRSFAASTQNIKNYDMHKKLYVRCVRYTKPLADVPIQEASSVIKKWPKLSATQHKTFKRIAKLLKEYAKPNIKWQSTPKANNLNLSLDEAVEYCRLLDVEGHKDWRIPYDAEIADSEAFIGAWKHIKNPKYRALWSYNRAMQSYLLLSYDPKHGHIMMDETYKGTAPVFCVRGK